MRKGSLAKLGVVLIAPFALGFAGLALLIGASGFRDPKPSHEGWMMVCFVIAGSLFVWWVACIVRVWTTREREDERIPRASITRRDRRKARSASRS